MSIYNPKYQWDVNVITYDDINKIIMDEFPEKEIVIGNNTYYNTLIVCYELKKYLSLQSSETLTTITSIKKFIETFNEFTTKITNDILNTYNYRIKPIYSLKYGTNFGIHREELFGNEENTNRLFINEYDDKSSIIIDIDNKLRQYYLELKKANKKQITTVFNKIKPEIISIIDKFKIKQSYEIEDISSRYYPNPYVNINDDQELKNNKIHYTTEICKYLLLISAPYRNVQGYEFLQMVNNTKKLTLEHIMDVDFSPIIPEFKEESLDVIVVANDKLTEETLKLQNDGVNISEAQRDDLVKRRLQPKQDYVYIKPKEPNNIFVLSGDKYELFINSLNDINQINIDIYNGEDAVGDNDEEEDETNGELTNDDKIIKYYGNSSTNIRKLIDGIVTEHITKWMGLFEKLIEEIKTMSGGIRPTVLANFMLYHRPINGIVNTEEQHYNFCNILNDKNENVEKIMERVMKLYNMIKSYYDRLNNPDNLNTNKHIITLIDKLLFMDVLRNKVFIEITRIKNDITNEKKESEKANLGGHSIFQGRDALLNTININNQLINQYTIIQAYINNNYKLFTSVNGLEKIKPNIRFVYNNENGPFNTLNMRPKSKMIIDNETKQTKEEFTLVKSIEQQLLLIINKINKMNTEMVNDYLGNDCNETNKVLITNNNPANLICVDIQSTNEFTAYTIRTLLDDNIKKLQSNNKNIEIVLNKYFTSVESRYDLYTNDETIEQRLGCLRTEYVENKTGILNYISSFYKKEEKPKSPLNHFELTLNNTLENLIYSYNNLKISEYFRIYNYYLNKLNQDGLFIDNQYEKESKNNMNISDKYVPKMINTIKNEINKFSIIRFETPTRKIKDVVFVDNYHYENSDNYWNNPIVIRNLSKDEIIYIRKYIRTEMALLHTQYEHIENKLKEPVEDELKYYQNILENNSEIKLERLMENMIDNKPKK